MQTYDKRDDFDFDIVFSGWRCPPAYLIWGVDIWLIRFGRASSNLSDFNCRNKALTAKRLRQGYCYFKLRKALSKFYRRQCLSRTRIPRIGCVACLKRQPFDMKKKKKKQKNIKKHWSL